MKLAIVGSTRLKDNSEALAIIKMVITLNKTTEVVSGGAVGIDTMAAQVAKDRGIPTKIFLPKIKNWAAGYKPRNIQIAKYCDKLIRIAIANAKSYGSGWTRDYAAKLNKPTEEYVIEI